MSLEPGCLAFSLGHSTCHVMCDLWQVTQFCACFLISKVESTATEILTSQDCLKLVWVWDNTRYAWWQCLTARPHSHSIVLVWKTPDMIKSVLVLAPVLLETTHGLLVSNSWTIIIAKPFYWQLHILLVNSFFWCHRHISCHLHSLF